ncbi:hypothetical protein R6V09_06720 [Streptomyces sp. W16]|uniref:ATP-binding protein n=1 Tax=Streptomyces sp. W16 TaxID=3076631 RepID=UPI00295AD0FF|nr:hypothetical protein [Streptomyces sp. W16]MDV9169829.1 hypothetical protein [Streptomyces sp. W16]
MVLYTCTFDSAVAAKALSALSDFAERRGWTVVHELYDLAPLDSPRRHRTAWRTVEHALAGGGATGIVAPAEQEIAWYPGDRTALRAWLLGVPAFAAYPQARRWEKERTYDVAAATTVFTDVGAPVDRQWSRSYPLHPTSARQVRTDALTYLTVLGWTGDIVAAVGVLDRLAKNAIVHALPTGAAGAQMDVLLAVTEDGELRIGIRDPSPEFPDSEAALKGERGRGLWDVCLFGADVTWSLAEDGRSKTVRARMAPGEVPA